MAKSMYPTRKHDTCVPIKIMGPDRKPKPHYFCGDDCPQPKWTIRKVGHKWVAYDPKDNRWYHYNSWHVAMFAVSNAISWRKLWKDRGLD